MELHKTRLFDVAVTRDKKAHGGEGGDNNDGEGSNDHADFSNQDADKFATLFFFVIHTVYYIFFVQI